MYASMRKSGRLRGCTGVSTKGAGREGRAWTYQTAHRPYAECGARLACAVPCACGDPAQHGAEFEKDAGGVVQRLKREMSLSVDERRSRDGGNRRSRGDDADMTSRGRAGGF